MNTQRSHQALKFTKADAALFSIDDAQLKAEALRYDVLPRLEFLLRDALAKINEVYGEDPLDRSTLGLLPAFRTNRRKVPVKWNYASCDAGITGKRSITWVGAIRNDGHAAKVFPYRLAIELGPTGLRTILHSWFDAPLNKASKRRLLNVLRNNWDNISQLLRIGDMSLTPCYADSLSFREEVARMVQNDETYFMIAGKSHSFPCTPTVNHGLIKSILLLYPIYDALIRTALNKPTRLKKHLSALEVYITENIEGFTSQGSKSNTTKTPSLDLVKIKERAEQRVPVMAGLRWRVLSRDGWKCTACGHSTREHGAVLHVDHIRPRSQGGANSQENYQTLCETCNWGKSNKDSTDLRATSKAKRRQR